MRKIFYDFEFISENKNLQVISLGMCDSNNNTLYLINSDIKEEDIEDDWLIKNVMNKLRIFNENEIKTLEIPLSEFKTKIMEFLGEEEYELWGYYSAYDHVLLCTCLAPRMVDMPKSVPYLTFDLEQVVRQHKIDKVWKPKPDPEKEHNAMYDAIWNMAYYSIVKKFME